MANFFTQNQYFLTFIWICWLRFSEVIHNDRHLGKGKTGFDSWKKKSYLAQKRINELLLGPKSTTEFLFKPVHLFIVSGGRHEKNR